MDLAPIIQRIRDEVFDLRRVDGAANLAAARTAPTSTPAAWVVPQADDAEPNQLVNAHQQAITSRFGVLICVSAHNRGISGGEDIEILHPIREAVSAALLGWVPPMIAPVSTTIEYARGRLMGLEDGRLWWQDDYRLTYHRRVPTS